MWGTNVSEPRPDVLVLQMPLHTCVHGLDPHREGYLFLYFSFMYCMYVCKIMYIFMLVSVCMFMLFYVYMYVCLFRLEFVPNIWCFPRTGEIWSF